MQGLLSIGVVERRGNRSYVVERLPDVSFDEVDDRKEFVRQLFETRRFLELPIIELATERQRRCSAPRSVTSPTGSATT